MANPLLDALGAVGNVLDMPGSYLRGALSGRPGERASGRELLQNWGVAGENQPGLDWGDVGGFGAEMVLDPLSLAAPALGAIKGLRGIQAGTRAAQALSHSDDANPLVKAMAGFAGDEVGAIGNPQALRLIREHDNPLGRFETLANQSPAAMTLDRVRQEQAYSNLVGNPGAIASYEPRPEITTAALDKYGLLPKDYSLPPGPLVHPNLQFDEWGDPEQMRELIRGSVKRGETVGPAHPDIPAVHELGHAFHDQSLQAAYPGTDNPFMNLVRSWRHLGTVPAPSLENAYQTFTPAVSDDIARQLGKYATTDPREFVAEAFANQMLRGAPLPRNLRSLYRDLHGPDLDKLPPEFLRTWWNLPRL